ncbi:MAG: STAS domain-containing protein [Planctomycetota bacterium]|jgi:anti-anti-sigma factor
MKVTLRRAGPVATCALRGDFDATVLGAFRREMERLLMQGVTTLVIDARAIRFISSGGLRALVETRRRCRELGGELAITRPSKSVRHIIDLLALDHALPASVDEASPCAAVI